MLRITTEIPHTCEGAVFMHEPPARGPAYVTTSGFGLSMNVGVPYLSTQTLRSLYSHAPQPGWASVTSWRYYVHSQAPRAAVELRIYSVGARSLCAGPRHVNTCSPDNALLLEIDGDGGAAVRLGRPRLFDGSDGGGVELSGVAFEAGPTVGAPCPYQASQPCPAADALGTLATMSYTLGAYAAPAFILPGAP